MPLRPWVRLTRTEQARNPWWTYLRDSFRLPNGRQGEYHYVHTNGSSMIIPVLPDGRCLLVNQYRYLAERESIEFPCGSVKDGATYELTAAHELREETGYEAGSLELAGSFNPYNGVTDEFCRVYIAHDLHFAGAMPDETEEFELLTLGPAEIDGRIADGTVWDGMTIAAWCIASRQLRPHNP